jgi:16S rRNA processing protein RimM
MSRVLVAQIGAAHGLRGEVRLRSFTAEPMAVKDYGVLESEDGTQRFEIESLRPAKDVLIARLAGVADRNAAERLCNLRLYVARDRLPAPDNDEFYYADLIGLSAVASDSREIGTVVGLQNFGAGDLVEIKLTDGATVMLPFTKRIVPRIEIAAGRIVVDPPDGALDAVAPPLAGEGEASG